MTADECGGRAFGYDNVEVVGPDGLRSHLERHANEQAAAVVRRIFAMCAAGKGVKAIVELRLSWDTVETRRAAAEWSCIYAKYGSGTGNRTPVPWLRTTYPDP